MYKLLLLLLIPTLSLGQYNRDVYMCKYVGKPTVTPPSNNSISIDCTNNLVWLGNRTNNTWSDITSTSTGQGYLAKGKDGKDGVCPSCPPTSGGIFPFNIVINNGTDNRTQVQAAIDETYSSGKPIFLIGKDFKMSGGVVIPKDIRFISIDGGAELTAINSGAWTFFSSPVPLSVSDAEDIYTNRRIIFRNIKFQGMGMAQTGIDLMCTEGAIYDFIEGKELKLMINNSFGLRSDISNCEAVNCIDGIKVQSAIGRYANTTIENSAPNGTTIRNFRWVASSTSNVGVLIKDCSGCKIDYITIEGHKSNIGVDWDCTSPSATGALIDIIHFEGAQPCATAVVRITSSTMLHTITNLNTIKPSVYVEVIPLSGGNPDVEISSVSNQRVLFNGTPVFKTQKGVMWTFNRTDNPISEAFYTEGVNYTYHNLFTGAPMQLVCGRENLAGNNSGLCIKNSPKK